MELSHKFTVPAPVEVAWEVFNDLERVTPCFPGAALTAYDAERRPATTKLVKRSRSVGRVGQTENPLLCTIRDALFTVGGKLVALRARK